MGKKGCGGVKYR